MYPKATKNYKGESRKCVCYVIEGGLYGHEIAPPAATPKWRATGGQCTVEDKVPGSNPGREPLLMTLLFGGKTKRGTRRLG